jgi:hypothetical protein
VRWSALPLRSIKGSVPFLVPFWASKKGLAEGTHHFTKNQGSIFKIHFIRTKALQPNT